MYGFFIKWKANRSALHWIGFRFQYAKAQRARVMLNVEPTPGLSPRKISRGGGDGFLTAMTRMIAETGQVTYMRLLSEMNNGVNFYSPRDESGRSRGPAYSTQRLQAGLAALGDHPARRRGGEHEPPAEAPPPAEGQDGREAAARGARGLVWVPLSFGNPETEYNHPKHFWPGAGYVDWVGTTWYSPHPNEGAMDRFYDYPKWNAQAVHVRRVGRLGRRVAGLRGQVLRLPEVAPARADGRVLPVGQPQAGVPPVDPSALARGASRSGRAGRACSALAPEFGG